MRRVDEEKLAYTRREAAELTGYSWDVITAAIRSGELAEVRPKVDGKPVGRGVIRRKDLEAWLEAVA